MTMDSSITADTEMEADEQEPPQQEGRKEYGLEVYSYDGCEYLVANSDDEADEAAAEKIKADLWAFRASFIARHVNVDLDATCIKAIEEMQAKLCESCNPIIEALLGENLDAFIDDAIESDGRGHFLAGYDSEEQEGADIHPSWDGKLAYRIN